MLEKLIVWSIKNKVIVIFLTVILIGVGIQSLLNTPVDAIPDLSDVPGDRVRRVSGAFAAHDRRPGHLSAHDLALSVPGAKAVRGYSFFGYSLVYVIFKDGTDIYWARSRVLEYLNYAQKRLPAGVLPTLGPDATGVGWVYEYALTSTTRSLAGAALATGLVPEIRFVKC